MPELPDVTIYIEAIERRVAGRTLTNLRLASPFILRSVAPPLSDLIGRRVVALRRIGKRIVLELDDTYFIVIHLMIAGRFRWSAAGAKLSVRTAAAAFDFADGTLLLTEAGSKKRASIHLVHGEEALAGFTPGGIEPLQCGFDTFRTILLSENHTLKRALTDPHLFSGIGSAYSDEILHQARLSPIKLTSKLSGQEVEQLFEATREVLNGWIERLRQQTGDRFPEKVTAFRPEMAVHGKYRQPCPVCNTPVQRIVYADNETNYCPRCQTEGRLLADRAMSRLLKSDWPRSIDEL